MHLSRKIKRNIVMRNECEQVENISVLGGWSVIKLVHLQA